MIYTDLERIYKTQGIENKYALAMIVSTRARQLSEQKGRQFDGEGSELCITHAIEEVEHDRLNVEMTLVGSDANRPQATGTRDEPAGTEEE